MTSMPNLQTIALLAAILIVLNIQSKLPSTPVIEYSRNLGELGELRSTKADTENVVGSLAIESSKRDSEVRHFLVVLQRKLGRGCYTENLLINLEQKELVAISRMSKFAKSVKTKLQHLALISRRLKMDELKVKALEKQERLKYRSRMNAKTKHAKAQTDHPNWMEKLAKLVVAQIEPQLQRQEKEISDLKHPTLQRKLQTGRQSSSLERRVKLLSTNTLKKRGAAILNMVDYNMRADAGAGGEDPGLGAEPSSNYFGKPANWVNSAISWNSAPWKSPERKGGPCSVAGDCSHGMNTVRDPEYWKKLSRERYSWSAGDSNKPADGLVSEDGKVPVKGMPTVTDEVLLSHPIAEAVAPSLPLSLNLAISSLKASAPTLPENNVLIAGATQFSVGKHGLYSFCTPKADGSIVFVDNERVGDECATEGTTGTEQADATESCGTAELLTGAHLIRVVAFKGANSPSLTISYSGPDSDNVEQPLSPSSSWTIRAFQSSSSTWNKWISFVCNQQKKYFLGDEELMSDLDDFLPPNDAYVHDQLTSGNYGYDHFGNLAPMSKANQELMYGQDFEKIPKSIFGKQLHSPGKGGAGHFSDARSRIGDEQIDDDDREVPVKLSNGVFPGEDHDHFGHWKWNSPLNQNLLNGMYWKHLKKDGLMDRLMPTSEAYNQRKGASHDSHPGVDLFVDSWNIGHGHGPAYSIPAVDALKLADAKLFEHFIGETATETMDFQGSADFQPNIPALPEDKYVVAVKGAVTIQNSGTYLLCASSGDKGILFMDRTPLLMLDGNSSALGTCVTRPLLAGEHVTKAVLFQANPNATFAATYRYEGDSGPDTLYNNTLESRSLPASAGWAVAAFASSAARFDQWYAAYEDPDETMRAWTEQHPAPWVQDRIATQGKDWRNRVFTGTGERIEGHQGVVANNLKDGGALGSFTNAFF